MPKEKGPRPLVSVALNSLFEMPLSLLASSACTPDDSICRATGPTRLMPCLSLHGKDPRNFRQQQWGLVMWWLSRR